MIQRNLILCDRNQKPFIFLTGLCAITAFNVDWWEAFTKLWHGKMIAAALVTLFDLCLPFYVANLSFALPQCAPKQPVLNKTCSIYRLQKYEWILTSASIFTRPYACELLKYRFLLLREGWGCHNPVPAATSEQINVDAELCHWLKRTYCTMDRLKIILWCLQNVFVKFKLKFCTNLSFKLIKFAPYLVQVFFFSFNCKWASAFQKRVEPFCSDLTLQISKTAESTA